MEGSILKNIFRNCGENADRPVYQWIDANCAATDVITYEELARKSAELAAELELRLQLNSRDKVVLCYHSGPEFAIALIACIRAGITAVPVNPPTRLSSPETEILKWIVLDCATKCVLTNNQFLSSVDTTLIEELKAKTGSWYSTTDPIQWDKHSATSVGQNEAKTEIPLVLYTSDRPGKSRGVMLSHTNLHHNFELLQNVVKCDHTVSAVCIYPHYSPVGLLAHYLFTPFVGGTCHFISLDDVVKTPGLWSRVITKFKPILSLVPNHILDMEVCTDTESEVDFSSLQFLGNCSESISSHTIEQFRTKFSSHGLRSDILCRVFCLLEHTLFLAASVQSENMSDYRNVGIPHPSINIKIVYPDQCKVVMDEEEGEVCVSSKSKAVGYWNRDGLSENFQTKLGDSGVYLRTGFLGFIHSSGDIYICGKREDMLEVRSKKFYLSDIEYRLESLFNQLIPGRTAAVIWDSSTLLAETSPSLSPDLPHRKRIGFFAEIWNSHVKNCYTLPETIASQIGREFHGLQTRYIALLREGSVPSHKLGNAYRQLCESPVHVQVMYEWWPSSNESRGASKEYVPQPPTPIPSFRQCTRDKPLVPTTIFSPNIPQLNFEGAAPPTTSAPTLSIPKPTVTSEPDVASEAPPTTNDVTPTVPRKQSRFHLEDTGAVSEAAQKTPLVDHLAPPHMAGREKSPRLVGQEKAVLSIISRVLEEDVDLDSNIWELGCDSLSAIEISNRLEQHLGFSVEPHLLFAYQTPRALLEKLKRTLLHLCSPVSTTQHTRDEKEIPHSKTEGVPPHPMLPGREDEVAIVGMACRFPGCSSPEEFWDLLTQKKVIISHVQDPASGKWIHGGFTDKMAIFDHEWFDISEKEASTMDPQQSILLHTTSECLHRSGYHSKDEVRGSNIGVFIGFWGSDARAMSLDSKSPYTGYIGTLSANRISYVFGLEGPSMAIDTACAASLTALDVAVTYLWQNKCSAALVGGVNALLDPRMFDISSEMGVLSPQGQSLVFSAEADGYVRGEGCGVILLKTVRNALKHGDRILAVVKSVESFHNGTSATPTAPNSKAQSRLLRASLDTAMLNPSNVSYLEAHGTGTRLGDPMEIAAIQEVFGQIDEKREPRVGPLVVGSVKANFGHLEAAAGMAGLIKTVLILQHCKVPGNPGLKTLNPAFNIDPDQILIPRETVALDSHYVYRPHIMNVLSAAVSGFGIGGSITSAVLQQYSLLPHLEQTQCSLVLNGEMGDMTADELMAVIQLLRARLPLFNSAYHSCMEAFCRAIKPVKIQNCDIYCQHPAYLTFCLLYCLTRTLQGHGMDFSLLMGTTLCAEIVVLAVADVLILSDSMRLLLAGIVPHIFNVRFIMEDDMEPTIPFISLTLNQMCLPRKFLPVLLDQLIHEIQHSDLMQSTVNDISLTDRLISIIEMTAVNNHSPLLLLLLQPNSPFANRATKTSEKDVLLRLDMAGLIIHLREIFLRLQSISKKTTPQGELPSETAEMPGFYDRFQMRTALRGSTFSHVKSQVHRPRASSVPLTREPGPRGGRIKPKHRLSWGDESGYLTHVASSESLKTTSTPFTSPTKPHTSSPASDTNKSDKTIAASADAIFLDLMSFVKKEIVSDLQLSDQEAGEKTLLTIGVDSVAQLELQDHLLQTWKLDIPFVRIMTDLNTVQSIATEVAKLLAEKDKESKNRGQYYTIPSSDELNLYSKEKQSAVLKFTVGRWGFGRVQFLGTVDISGMDLNSQLMEIEHESMQPCETTKSILNKPALLFFENPSEGDSDTAEERGEKLVSAMGESAILINDDKETGEVVIKIEKFP